MQGNSTRENRETPSTPVATTGRLEKALSPKSNMHVGGGSDDRTVPAKYPNNGEQAPAEGMEGRRGAAPQISLELMAIDSGLAADRGDRSAVAAEQPEILRKVLGGHRLPCAGFRLDITGPPARAS